ncbi:MAG: thiamine-phosphate synthase family protein, partial [Sulfolobales archaeon]
YARRDARDLNDIIAYPGRIIKVNEAIIAVGKPSWGASRHLGSILLKIRVERPELRALASVRVHECLDRWMKNSDISLEISDDRDNIRESDIIERVSRAFTSSSKIYIVEDPGGRGFEPIVYIAGENPLRIALILEKILKTC